ncbi:MAG TPA: hypothetical protein VD994_21825 [Prosthecobacter sp.]|nr:hypothetical protein [Prosthecobacter sp.]
MNTYWLSEGPGEPGEGPLTLAQIQGMLARKLISAEAFVCPVESTNWRGVQEELSAQQENLPAPPATPPKQRSWDKPIDQPEEEAPAVATL